MLDFSALVNAVKPRERTPQYLVLATLYFLHAHVTPVTAKDVKDMLTMHVGKKTPPNINGCLRAYGSYVEVAAQGYPLRWLLTKNGLDHFRSLSGLELAAEAPVSDFGVDVGIICALEHPEFEAVFAAFGGAGTWEEFGDARFTHVYRKCTVKTVAGKLLSVIATTSTSMGLTAAAIATTQLVLQFRPRIVLMIGIAAGTRGGDRQFGDVLIADPSIDYNSGKVVLANGIRDFLPDPYPIGLNPRLRSVLHKYRGNSNAVLGKIRSKWHGSLPSGPNRIHMGPLGAADQVIDDPTRILEIQRNWRKLIGVEMETYGVYRACHESPDPKPRFVSFKSVCDFAAEKTDSWQPFAAFIAAEFAFNFLQIEWDALWPIA